MPHPKPTAPRVLIGNDFRPYDVRQSADAYTAVPGRQVDHIVVHHDAGPVLRYPSPDDEANRLGVIRNTHLARGWPGIAYHFVVFHTRAYYTGDWTTVRYHAAPLNPTSIGVCLAGDFSHRPPPLRQLRLLRLAIANIEFMFGRRLLLQGHRDVTATTCPGPWWDDPHHRAFFEDR